MLELFHYTQTEQDKLIKSITILVDTREHDGKNDRRGHAPESHRK